MTDPNNKKPEKKRMRITKEQAHELADKYLMYTGKYALRDNIFVSRNVRGWQILAKTTPMILGMPTEITSFTIDVETGEVGVAITGTVSITAVLKEINQRKDIDETKKEQLKNKVEEVEDATKKSVDRNKVKNLKKWFEKNASYLKSIIDVINTLLKLGSG